MVTVLEGKVALGEAVPSGKVFQAKQVLKANQRLSLNDARAGQAPADVEAQNLLAWRDRQLIFKGRPLVEVTRELERYFAVEISFATPDLANREITAVIQLSDQKTTLNQLALALGLTWDDGSKQGQLRLADKSPPSVD
jgi:ferric-dicitrate binding protein FerR (iron transport regulator)